MVNGRSLVLGLAVTVAVVSTAAAQVSGTATAPATAVVPFPADARIGLVDFNRVAAASAAGKALSTRIQELRSKKEAEVQARSKEVAALESKLAQSSTVLNDEARDQLQRQFERARVDFQRMSEDAQAEVQQVQRELEQAFLAKARPVVEAVAREKSLWAVLSLAESGLVWWEPALDLSDEIAKRIDASAER